MRRMTPPAYPTYDAYVRYFQIAEPQEDEGGIRRLPLSIIQSR